MFLDPLVPPGWFSYSCCEHRRPQISTQKDWGSRKFVRLICCGRELHLSDPISRAPSDVLHCTATDEPPLPLKPAALHSGKAGGDNSVDWDWLDAVDPGIVLMWMFGSILALLWVLLIFNGALNRLATCPAVTASPSRRVLHPCRPMHPEMLS